MFLRDLNATLNDDGTVTISGFEESDDGELERVDNDIRNTFENDPHYETNRSALAGATFAPDGFDRQIMETFQLPVEARYERFESLYGQAIQGDGASLSECWGMIPDSAKLVFTLHLWERLQKRKLYPGVWAAALHLSWPHGKVGSMMFRANLSEKEVVQMFLNSPAHILMAPEDLSIYNTLPNDITVWRGVSSKSKFRERGFSWTLDRERAEWFALANTHEGQPIVLERKITKASVLMCSTFEEEVVVNPLALTSIAIRTELQIADKSERLAALREALAKRHKAKNLDAAEQIAA